ncbi:MAG TPA: hypothetical protein VFW11_00690 [Cyclobacteriaceae bacterium]|nr:hypothetical protein [Cyclobacteriaceae bacterium]
MAILKIKAASNEIQLLELIKDTLRVFRESRGSNGEALFIMNMIISLRIANTEASREEEKANINLAIEVFRQYKAKVRERPPI